MRIEAGRFIGYFDQESYVPGDVKSGLEGAVKKVIRLFLEARDSRNRCADKGVQVDKDSYRKNSNIVIISDLRQHGTY